MPRYKACPAGLGANNSPVRFRYVLAIALIAVTNVTRAAVGFDTPGVGADGSGSSKKSVLSPARHRLDRAAQVRRCRAVLHEALSLNPQNTTCLYDLAGVDVALGRRKDAIKTLESATDAGFTDFTQIEISPHLPYCGTCHGIKACCRAGMKYVTIPASEF